MTPTEVTLGPTGKEVLRNYLHTHSDRGRLNLEEAGGSSSTDVLKQSAFKRTNEEDMLFRVTCQSRGYGNDIHHPVAELPSDPTRLPSVADEQLVRVSDSDHLVSIIL